VPTRDSRSIDEFFTKNYKKLQKINSVLQVSAALSPAAADGGTPVGKLSLIL
jgi:hypothetical protein